MDKVCKVCNTVLTELDIDYINEFQPPFLLCAECLNNWLEFEDAWSKKYDKEDRDLLRH